MKRTSILIPIAILVAWLSATGYTLVAAGSLAAEPTGQLPVIVAPLVNIEADASHS